MNACWHSSSNNRGYRSTIEKAVLKVSKIVFKAMIDVRCMIGRISDSSWTTIDNQQCSSDQVCEYCLFHQRREGRGAALLNVPLPYHDIDMLSHMITINISISVIFHIVTKEREKSTCPQLL